MAQIPQQPQPSTEEQPTELEMIIMALAQQTNRLAQLMQEKPEQVQKRLPFEVVGTVYPFLSKLANEVAEIEAAIVERLEPIEAFVEACQHSEMMHSQREYRDFLVSLISVIDFAAEKIDGDDKAIRFANGKTINLAELRQSATEMIKGLEIIEQYQQGDEDEEEEEDEDEPEQDEGQEPEPKVEQPDEEADAQKEKKS